METNCYNGVCSDHAPQTKADHLAREIIEKIADKWTIVVVDTLGTHGELRFSRLKEEVGGCSQKMLTKTLRQLERDGFISRYVHPVIPPRVDYQLTPLGRSLLEKIGEIWLWVATHMNEMESARCQFDRVEKEAKGAVVTILRRPQAPRRAP